MIATPDQYIHYISPFNLGKTHDFKCLKQLFAPSVEWFKHWIILVDSGYQGFQNDYVCQRVDLPYKKTKNKVLSAEEKSFNRQLSSKRIAVENSLSGLKRYRVLINRIRSHAADLYDNILGCCAGLWNFYLRN